MVHRSRILTSTTAVHLLNNSNMYLARSEPQPTTALPPKATLAAATASGPSAHTILVRSIVVGVIAVVLGLCVVIWVIYMLRSWWAIRAEALRPRGIRAYSFSSYTWLDVDLGLIDSGARAHSA